MQAEEGEGNETRVSDIAQSSKVSTIVGPHATVKEICRAFDKKRKNNQANSVGWYAQKKKGVMVGVAKKIQGEECNTTANSWTFSSKSVQSL